MNVFLSWSGDTSKAVASFLRDWLSQLFPEADFWMSDLDLQAGQRWAAELDQQLARTDIGVLCLVPDNLMAPWLLFEAGALSKSIDSACVIPYCFGLDTQNVQGPLSRFQGVSANEIGTLKLIRGINARIDKKRSDKQLEDAYKKWWPDLQAHLEQIPTSVGQRLKEPEFFDASGEYGTESEWLRLLAETRQAFDILGITLDSWRKRRDFDNLVLAKANEGCAIRVLLMHESNGTLRSDWFPENQYDSVAHDIKENGAFYVGLATTQRNVHVRGIRRGIPHFSMTRTDNYAVLTQYLYFEKYGGGPLWRCSNRSKLYQTVSREFETFWKDGVALV